MIFFCGSTKWNLSDHPGEISEDVWSLRRTPQAMDLSWCLPKSIASSYFCIMCPIFQQPFWAQDSTELDPTLLITGACCLKGSCWSRRISRRRNSPDSAWTSQPSGTLTVCYGIDGPKNRGFTYNIIYIYIKYWKVVIFNSSVKLAEASMRLSFSNLRKPDLSFSATTRGRIFIEIFQSIVCVLHSLS